MMIPSWMTVMMRMMLRIARDRWWGDRVEEGVINLFI